MVVEALVLPDAARVTIRIATRATPRGATVYTNAPKRLRETISTNLCTLLRLHGRSCDRSVGRFLEQRALPLGGERAGVERSGPSGSMIGTLRPEWQCHPHEAARSGASGSASHTAKWHRAYRSGTLGVEWQCDRYAQGRVAVQFTLPLGGERAGMERSGPSGSVIGTLKVEWQCHPHEAARSGPSGSAGPGDLRAGGCCAQCRDAPQEGSSRALPGTVSP